MTSPRFKVRPSTPQSFRVSLAVTTLTVFVLEFYCRFTFGFDCARIPRFNCMTCAGRGVSLEQRTHRPVMFQSFLCYLALRSQRLRRPLIAPMPATTFRGTGPLRSLHVDVES